MAEIELPQLGESVTDGIILEWLVDVGDEIEADQPIVEISTDKVDTEIPSPVGGVVTELRAEVDEIVAVGSTLAVVEPSAGTDGQRPDTPAEAEQPEEAGEDEPARQQAAEPEPSPDGDAGHDYDVIIIGAGTGGYSCALRAAQLGLDVALVERDLVGGTCLHRGCIPAKAILTTAEVAEHAQEAGDFGVELDYGGIDVDGMNAHKDSVVGRMHRGLQGSLDARGVDTIRGTASLVDARTVRVEPVGDDGDDGDDGDAGDDGVRELSAPAVVVATGSRPRDVPMVEVDGERVVNSDHALYLDELPGSAIVLGSGAVGMEFATAWNSFGVEVTVVELLDRLLPNEDADASKEIRRQFRRQGIDVLTSTRMTDVEVDGGVVCTVEDDDGEQDKLEADMLLVAVGRAPVTEGLGLEEVGVTTDDGYVVVDGYGRTEVEGVYAVGDVIPTLGLAHASFAEGYLVADQLAGLDVVPIDYRGVPRVIYCHPEVASVGYTEQEATDAGFEVVTDRHPFQALGRGATMNASGMVKVVAEADDAAEGGAGRVLGIHMVGPRATDLISEAELIYNWEALPSEVAQFFHPHPSLGEAIGEVSLSLAGRALHGA